MTVLGFVSIIKNGNNLVWYAGRRVPIVPKTCFAILAKWMPVEVLEN